MNLVLRLRGGSNNLTTAQLQVLECNVQTHKDIKAALGIRSREIAKLKAQLQLQILKTELFSSFTAVS